MKGAALRLEIQGAYLFIGMSVSNAQKQSVRQLVLKVDSNSIVTYLEYSSVVNTFAVFTVLSNSKLYIPFSNTSLVHMSTCDLNLNCSTPSITNSSTSSLLMNPEIIIF